MSEVLEQENAIILAAAQKFVALGSDSSQRSLLGQESDDQEQHSDKILKYLTVYRQSSNLDVKALEAILYALRDLSEANLFPTVDPIVGQSIQYLVSQSAVTISDTMQIQSNGSDLTLVDTLNFYNLLTASYDSANGRVNVVFGGALTQNTTATLGTYNLTFGASSTGGFAVNFGADADYDLFYRASGKWARLPIGDTDGYVLKRVGGALAWAAESGSGYYDTIQNAGSGLTQRATLNFSGALLAVDNAGAFKTDITVKNSGITYAMIQNVTNGKLLGNATGSGAAPSEISVSGPLTIGSSTLSITQSGTSTDGYLAASDWNTFNTKLSKSLTDGYFFVGNGSGVATGVAMSADASLANTGAVTVTWANGYTTYDARYLKLAGGTLTGALTLNADPTNSLHAATKNYVDNLITGISWKNEVVTATTANITLSGEQTIDDVLTNGSRILVKNQTDQTENGIYLTGSGSWTRTSDADTGAEIAMSTVLVAGGTTYEGTQWTCTNTAVTLGATNITFGQISGSGTYTNGVGLSLSGNSFSITTNGVVNSLIRPSAALSVIGRSTNSTGDVADISAFVDGDVLRRSGTTLSFGTIGDTSISGLAWSKITGTPTTLAGYGITDSFSSALASGKIFVGSGGGVATGVSMSGQATIDNTGSVTLSNAAVIGKVLTGYTSGAGVVSASDTILQAIQKLNGNIALTVVDPMTTRGDIIYRNSSNVTERLPIGSNTYVLTSDGTDISWSAPSGGGIGGSTGSVDNAMLRADGVGGSTLQASSVFVDDSGNVQMGTGSIPGQRQIQAYSSDISQLVFGIGGVNYLTLDTTGLTVGLSGSYRQIRGTPSNSHGSRFLILGETPNTGGIRNGGSLLLDGGTGVSGGKNGNVGAFIQFDPDWKDMENGLFIGNATTTPTAGIANGNAIYSKDVSSSSELFVKDEAGFETQIS